MELQFAPSHNNTSELVSSEIRHRLRNLLAMMQAIVRQSLQNAATKEDAEREISERLHSLSKANDLLIEGRSDRLSLKALILRLLAVHDWGGKSRFQVRGPAVFLDQRASFGLALILHELATNAAKYGALSNERGRVYLTWALERKASEEFLKFRWKERGGPAISAPTVHGFGTQLIKSVLRDAGVTTDLSFPTTGLTFNLRLPLQHVLGVGNRAEAARADRYDALLNQALEATFPASDPPAMLQPASERP